VGTHVATRRWYRSARNRVPGSNAAALLASTTDPWSARGRIRHSERRQSRWTVPFCDSRAQSVVDVAPVRPRHRVVRPRRRLALCPSGGALDDGGEVVPVRPVAEFAAHHDELAHSERDWICIPLHEPDSAKVTDEFVAFTDHSLHGQIFVFERDGGATSPTRTPSVPRSSRTGSATGTPTTCRRRIHRPTTHR